MSINPKVDLQDVEECLLVTFESVKSDCRCKHYSNILISKSDDLEGIKIHIEPINSSHFVIKLKTLNDMIKQIKPQWEHYIGKI